MTNEHDEDEAMRLENELKKIKLSLEHGAKFHEGEGTEMPAEIESQWLDYIQAFEEAAQEKRLINFYVRIGSPEYKKVDEIAEGDMEAALDAMMAILERNGIILETVCDVDERELYRFITEDLFAEEMADIRFDGLRTHYLYEEFYPNFEYDAIRITRDFVDTFMKEQELPDPVFMHFAYEMSYRGTTIPAEEYVRRLELFRESFKGFELKDYELRRVDVAADGATAIFHIVYTGITEGGQTMEFSGSGTIRYKREGNGNI